MAAMTRVPWGALESVGDQSEYVNNINIILTGSVPTLGSLLSPVYFQFFLDKAVTGTHWQSIFLFSCYVIRYSSCKDNTFRHSIPWETGCYFLNKYDLGSLCYLGYDIRSCWLSREMSKAEALLKVILSPIDSVADTYGALLPEGTPSEFQRILELKVRSEWNPQKGELERDQVGKMYPRAQDCTQSLKGLKKADQQTILDDFNKRGSGSPAATQAAQVAVTPVPPPMASTPSAAVIASREDVLTRAAALGRGAATTGFKRFLALTEAAKDRKDGPFRKLFNA
ncbi:hypothetical protein L1987_56671 [Smallanthus sonchifolius]|uniref:Uncharacterized protein n=1 Tax=Smallanthus sonchifolius TaxID=185202 RepID=A0ACB9ECV3_9ASTR|nr:hypothetical protein L1987_56671 [Smallanthus sonchifolius]